MHGTATTPELLATFHVNENLLALQAGTVQEVIRVGEIRRVPNAAPQVVGIVNLRGRIVTLLDLAPVLGGESTSLTKESRVIIVEDKGELIGLLVSRVAEVIEISPEKREPLPVNLNPAQARCFECVYRSGDAVVALLDAGAALNESDAAGQEDARS